MQKRTARQLGRRGKQQTPTRRFSVQSSAQASGRDPALPPFIDLPPGGEVIAGAVHEFRNHLQSIIVGLDLMQLTQDDSLECQQMRQEIQRACRLLQEVQEYFFPPPWSLSAESLAAIVREVVQRKQDEWHSQDIRLRVICHDPPSALQLDWRQVQSALERVLAFARALLSQGGMLEVTAQMRKQSGQPWIELKVISSAVTALEVEEQDVFQPFLRVNDYQLGLSLTLVHQMVDRQHGRVSFRKTNPRRGCFTLLLKAFPS